MQKSFITVFLCLGLWVSGCGGAGDSSLTANAAPVAPAPNADVLRQQLTEAFEAGGARAMLVTVRSGEKEVLSLALGESMTGVPVTLDDHVRIGGVSELFQGILLMQMVDKGELSLDDKVSKWLPDFPLAANQVTVGMLLKTLAGYKDYVVDPEFVKEVTDEPFRSFSRDQLIAYAVRNGEMNFPPGTQQKYSHTEFTILGKVMEKASGQSMEALHQERILQPLGLQDTGYMHTAALPGPVLHAYSSDRGVYEDCTFWNPSWTGDSGPLYSTLGDLAIWARAHGRGRLLSPASFETLKSRPAVAVTPGLYFAAGFIVNNGWFCQNPSFNGYSGAYGYLPEQDLTVIIYTTQSPDPKTDRQAFAIFKEVVNSLTPDHSITF